MTKHFEWGWHHNLLRRNFGRHTLPANWSGRISVDMLIVAQKPDKRIQYLLNNNYCVCHAEPRHYRKGRSFPLSFFGRHGTWYENEKQCMHGWGGGERGGGETGGLNFPLPYIILSVPTPLPPPPPHPFRLFVLFLLRNITIYCNFVSFSSALSLSFPASRHFPPL